MAKVELKQPVVQAIAEDVKDAVSVVLVDYRGLSVAEDTEMRKQLREAGVVYKVCKNTMMKRAFEGTDFAQLDEYLEGPNAIAISKEDATAPARIICDFAKKAEALEVKAGVVEGTVYDAAGIQELSKIARKHDLLLIVDNTFLSPYFQKPIRFGADLVIHSGTKFLGGHNDTLAGFLSTSRDDLAAKIRYLYKTVGSCLAPFDSYLLIRGIKTLPIRMERQQENALAIAKWLQTQKKIKQVYYIGLEDHPGYEINKKQTTGFGSMISIRTDSEATARRVLERIRLITYAESLGGVESLMTYPMLQTHGDVPVETRERLGITEDFLRFSVGIENVDDLIADLDQALNGED